MTESEWLSCTDAPWSLLDFVAEKASARKIRLFGIALWFRYHELRGDVDSGTQRYREEAYRFVDEGEVPPGVSKNWALYRVEPLTFAGGALNTYTTPPTTSVRVHPQRQVFIRSRQACELLRDLMGNPFHQLTPRTFPGSVLGLAQEIDAGDHSLYPILADALEDSNEHAAANHCRDPLHTRGCHVIDWILARQ